MIRFHKRVQFAIILALTAALFFLRVLPASAHPLGNFTINHFTEIRVHPSGVAIEFVLDMAEIPAYQEITNLDRNANAVADPDEYAAYPAQQCSSILQQIELHHNQSLLPLTLSHSEIAFPAGAGGLPTLRLTCSFASPEINVSAQDQLSFADRSFSERLGWREMIVTSDGVSLSGDFADRTISDRLTNYPQDMLASPLDVRQVGFSIGAVQSGQADNPVPVSGGQSAAANLPATREDQFTRLITLQELTPSSILVAFIIAFIWGGLHSMTPGHGKTIVAAYLVGSRGTPRHAVYLGLITTFTHTAGVFALGLVTLFASRYILPETLFPWISLLSGLFVIVIGLSLAVSRVRGWLARKNRRVSSLKLVHHPAIDSTPHHHTHLIGRTTHSHDGHEHHHDHHHDHHHLPPDVETGKVTWRNLLALGISGGLLPCPSALVVLLGAIALNRVSFGVFLVLAFSLGLAAVLTAIGLALVFARRYFDRFPARSRLFELIPAGSALVITILGIGITLRALAQLS